MMTSTNKLNLLLQTKANIKAAIEERGQTVGNIPFSQYAEKILAIESTSWGFYRNVAVEGSASASSVLNATSTPDKAIDGINNNNDSRWISASDGAPWFEVNLLQLAKVSKIVIYSSGTTMRDDDGYQISNFTLSGWGDGGWVNLANVNNNKLFKREITIEPTIINKIRMEMDAGINRMYEIEIYGETKL